MQVNRNQAESAAGAPQWTEKEVRKLLKLLKRPHLLAEFPLARALAQTLGKDSAAEAVLYAIDQTFIHRGMVGKRLRDLIWRCDVESSSTQAAAASDMNLSARQFFRYRSEAVLALAAYINRLFEPAHESVEPIEALARLLEDVDPDATVRLHAIGKTAVRENAAYAGARMMAGETFEDFQLPLDDAPASLIVAVKAAMAREIHGHHQASRDIVDAVRAKLFYRASPQRAQIEFEASVVDFVAARQSGIAQDMVAAAKRLRDIARNDSSLAVRAMLYEAEANIALGAYEAAETELFLVERLAWERRSVRDLGMATLRRAQVAFARGHASYAFEVATAARLALRRMPYADFQCSLLLARLSLLLGVPFALEAAPYDAPSWNFAYASALRARAALNSGELETARTTAERTAAIAAGYHAARAFNEATLAGIAIASGDPSAAQAQLIEAWATTVRTQNHLLARDVFENAGLQSRDLGPLAYNDAFSGAVTTVLAELFPHVSPFGDIKTARLLAPALREVVLCSVSAGPLDLESGTLRESVIAVRQHSGDLRALARHRDTLTRTLSFVFAAPLKFEMRTMFGEAFGKNLGRLLLELQKS